jgi:hypothetical protein
MAMGVADRPLFPRCYSAVLPAVISLFSDQERHEKYTYFKWLLVTSAPISKFFVNFAGIPTRRPGEGRDPLFRRTSGCSVDPGLRRDDM